MILISFKIKSMFLINFNVIIDFNILGKPEYKGAVDVLSKVVKQEGFFSLWKGFTPYYFRFECFF